MSMAEVVPTWPSWYTNYWGLHGQAEDLIHRRQLFDPGRVMVWCRYCCLRPQDAGVHVLDRPYGMIILKYLELIGSLMEYS